MIRRLLSVYLSGAVGNVYTSNSSQVFQMNRCVFRDVLCITNSQQLPFFSSLFSCINSLLFVTEHFQRSKLLNVKFATCYPNDLIHLLKSAKHYVPPKCNGIIVPSMKGLLSTAQSDLIIFRQLCSCRFFYDYRGSR